MGQLKPFKGNYYLWSYVPSIAAAIISLLCFAALTAICIYRLFKTRTWFCLPFAVGGIFQLYGYGGRIGAHINTASLFSYAISNQGVLLAPALYAATIYMILGRIIRALQAERLSPVPPKWMTRAFVLGDILSFVVQGSSVGLSVTGRNKGAMAVILLSLFIQIVSFGLFGFTSIIFYRRILRNPTSACFNSNMPWERILHMLNAVSALIMERSIFRVVENAMGTDGYLLRHEWTLYIFDSVPMLVVMVLFYIWYPSGLKAGGTRGFLFTYKFIMAAWTVSL
ncbi:putative RTA1 domain protein [Aspergillus tetrazonus]